MNYLIDTDIIIDSLKNNKTVIDNFRKYRRAPKSISVISYGELIFGARNSGFVEKNLAKIFRLAEIFPIIDISPSVVETFGEVKSYLVKNGMVIDDMDLLIAATALTQNLILVTNNEKHFRRIKGLDIVNWAKN